MTFLGHSCNVILRASSHASPKRVAQRRKREKVGLRGMIVRYLHLFSCAPRTAGVRQSAAGRQACFCSHKLLSLSFSVPFSLSPPFVISLCICLLSTQVQRWTGGFQGLSTCGSFLARQKERTEAGLGAERRYNSDPPWTQRREQVLHEHTS